MEEMQQQLQELTGAMNALVARDEQNQRTIAALQQAQQAQRAQQQQARPAAGRELDLFKIPDPIKSLPPFNGNRRQLPSWLRTAESTLNLFKEIVPDAQFTMYLQAVLNKIEGKARDVMCLAGPIGTFDELRNLLLGALGDRQELSTYKSQLWQNKMIEGDTIHKYYSRTNELVQNIKTLSKQTRIFNDHWEAINLFIEEDALAAFITGLRKPYFGYAQAAKPSNLEEAYAFVCKFTSYETSFVSQSPKPTKGTRQEFSTQKGVKGDKPPRDKADQRSLIEPMDVDKSLRSRMTFNKKLVNNHTCNEEKVEDSPPHDTVDEEVIVSNFWSVPLPNEKT